MPQAIKKAQAKIAAVKDTELLAGLGDLLDPKQRTWAKQKLKEETIFSLKLRSLDRKSTTLKQ